MQCQYNVTNLTKLYSIHSVTIHACNVTIQHIHVCNVNILCTHCHYKIYAVSLLCNVSIKCTHCHYMVYIVLLYGKHSVTDYYGEHSLLYDEQSVTMMILCTHYSDKVCTVL